MLLNLGVMNFTVFDSYVIKNLSVVTAFVAMTLAAIILLTQSLKFLELIINAGASSGAFWMLSFLALPRFFEVILPIALMIAGIFVYNRMTTDSEIIVMRAAGKSPFQMAKPALFLGLAVTVLLLFITAWLAPASLAQMVKMRQVVKAQYSTLLFQQGVFNEVGKNLTVYIDKRSPNGELEGLLIYDNRPKNPAPVTVIAKRGVVVATNEGQQVLVYDGSRQDFNKRTGALNRLDFDRYSIDLPDSVAVGARWKEPDERTFIELLRPDNKDEIDLKYKNEFIVEANRRVAGSFLPLTFIGTILCCLLLGPLNRRGQNYRILLAVILVILLQSLYLSIFGFVGKNMLGIFLMYFFVIIPFITALFFLSSFGEVLRQKMVFKPKQNLQGGAV